LAAPDAGIGARVVHLDDGRSMSFDDYLAREGVADGIVIVRGGAVVYERYPQMDADDTHLFFSTTKAVVGTLVGILEEEGRVDTARGVETYLPELAGTAWAGTSVRDILDMASGIAAPDGDIVHPAAPHYQLEASLGWLPIVPELPATVREAHTYEYLASLGRAGPPGRSFVYSSANSLVAGRLVEKLTGLTLAEAISDRIWSRIGAEHDAVICTNRRGIAVAHAGLAATVRDMARFGLHLLSHQPALVRRIQRGRDDIQKPSRTFPKDIPYRPGAYQWARAARGSDFFKGGYAGQLLYIAPERDLIVVFTGHDEMRDSKPPFSAVVLNQVLGL
jgi:CubicO group peptidase (beta-lactamase class C family)